MSQEEVWLSRDKEDERKKVPDSIRKGGMMKSDWSNLPTDLWSIVGYKLDTGVDRIHFRSVSNSLRSSLPFPQPPWLVLSEPDEPQPDSDDSEEEEEDDNVDNDQDEEEREEKEIGVGASACYVGEVNKNQPPIIPSPRGFVGLGDQQIYQLDLPEAHQKRFVGSTGTWLIMVDTEKQIYLLNPFSRVQIQLPSIDTFSNYEEKCYPKPRYPRDSFLRKVILSSSSAKDCIALAIHHSWRKPAILRPNDTSWKTFDAPGFRLHDIIFYKEQFYLVTYKGIVMVCDVSDDLCPPKVSMLMDECQLLNHKPEYNKLYLVEWMGNLLLVTKMTNNEEVFKYVNQEHLFHCKYLEKIEREEDTPLYKTEGFKVYKLDFTNRKWDEVKDLGEYSLFLGQNTSVSILASDSNGSIKKNCIYFTDDYEAGYCASGTPGGHAMGVFDMESNNIQPHYRGISTSRYSPPIWFIPTSLVKTTSDVVIEKKSDNPWLCNMKKWDEVGLCNLKKKSQQVACVNALLHIECAKCGRK